MIHINLVHAAFQLVVVLVAVRVGFWLGGLIEREKTDEQIALTQETVRQRTEAQNAAHIAQRQLQRIREMLRRQKNRKRGVDIA